MAASVPRRIYNWARFVGLGALGLACTDPAPARLSPEEARGSRRPPVSSASVLFIGHSLIGPHMPAMLAGVAESLGVEHAYASQVRDGASLQVNWKEGGLPEGVDARRELEKGTWDVVVMTEAVSLDDMIRWMEPVEYGGRFHALAMASNPRARTFMYETWHDRDVVRSRFFGLLRRGDWRAYLDDDLGKWERIVAGINARHEGRPMRIVPGGQAMARLTDALRAGQGPSGLSEADLFADAIHLSPLGSYFIALVHFATIYRRSPEGATHVPEDGEGRAVRIDPHVAAFMQRTAWEVVREYAWSGVTDDR
jgi:hypothetical protein